MRALVLLAALVAQGVAAQETVTSAAPTRVALTVYRAPDGRGAMNLDNLGGYALVTEWRRVSVPRGPAVLRFQGVAEGIVPVSAVVEGLPGGVVEKNRDARLLSPASLIDGTLGKQVTLTRTDRATGRRVSEQATIVAGPVPGVVLRTAAGIESLRCAGAPEKLAFGAVPAGLSREPVLSVATVSPVARTVTVRLSYLASGFDWRASYVATVRPDGAALDLFAWLTLANANGQAFAQAEVNAVAGRVNRVGTPEFAAAVAALSLKCFPLGTTTSDLREEQFEEAEPIILRSKMAEPPPPPAPMMALSVAQVAAVEQLGDVKLYRVPERASVSPRGQKQVALLKRDGVAFERRYRRAVYPGQALAASPTAVVLKLRNVKAVGLGLALPAGSTALYAGGGRGLLLGLGALTDRAEGEVFRLGAGVSTQVQVAQKLVLPGVAVLSASNANSFPVTLDVPIGAAGQKVTGDGLAEVDGVATWSPVLPPGGSAELRYRF